MSIESVMSRNVSQDLGRIKFMMEGGEPGLIQKACLGNADAKLKLVKAYLNLVVEIAAAYEIKTGHPFTKMVRAGATGILRAVKNFRHSQQTEFDEYVKIHIIEAMEENSYTESKLEAHVL